MLRARRPRRHLDGKGQFDTRNVSLQQVTIIDGVRNSRMEKQAIPVRLLLHTNYLRVVEDEFIKNIHT